MDERKRFHILSIGFAIFSMFFGAGNSIFPLILGTYAKDRNFYAILGLFITGIIVPVMGLIAMVLFRGDYKQFFYRIGKIPGFFVILLIMALIGPFAGIPRCVTLSFSTLKPHLGNLTLFFYSLGVGLLLFFTTIKRRSLLDLLGKVLTPLLLFCLTVVILKGFFFSTHDVPVTGFRRSTVFLDGLTMGYQMMDLLASFFFATVVLSCLKLKETDDSFEKRSTKIMLKSSLVSIVLLSLIYVGFSYVASFHSETFAGLPEDALLGAVGREILGMHAGFIMSLAVALACLTTAIALVSVFSQFIHEELFKNKIPYGYSIASTCLVSFVFANLGFSGICNMIGPLLEICYPALIVLSLLNIANKLFNFKPVKFPVYATFIGSLALRML